jgi:hypothetical protein
MAPHAGFHTDQIKDKSRKDLLYLLEGVSEGSVALIFARRQLIMIMLSAGARKEESGPGEESGWPNGHIRQVLDSPGLWRR